MRVAIVDDTLNELEMYSEKIKEAFEKRGIGLNLDSYQRIDGFINSSIVYDCVFLDIEMPDMDGITLSKKIKRYQINTNEGASRRILQVKKQVSTLCGRIVVTVT